MFGSSEQFYRWHSIGSLVLVNYDNVDYSVLPKLSDGMSDGKLSRSANPNTSTIWLFNSPVMDC